MTVTKRATDRRVTRARSVQGKDGPVALAVAILTGSADLRGAACTANARLFDPDVLAESLGYGSDRDREWAVETTCVSCSARGACWAWASGLSTQRVMGPTAATMGLAGSMRPRRGRPARTEAPTTASGRRSPASEDPDPEPAHPRPPRRPGARRRGRPSVHRRGTPRRSPR